MSLTRPCDIFYKYLFFSTLGDGLFLIKTKNPRFTSRIFRLRLYFRLNSDDPKTVKL